MKEWSNQNCGYGYRSGKGFAGVCEGEADGKGNTIKTMHCDQDDALRKAILCARHTK
jgi:hypothetical protein